jgi:hypothetical protein
MKALSVMMMALLLLFSAAGLQNVLANEKLPNKIPI